MLFWLKEHVSHSDSVSHQPHHLAIPRLLQFDALGTGFYRQVFLKFLNHFWLGEIANRLLKIRLSCAR